MLFEKQYVWLLWKMVPKFEDPLLRINKRTGEQVIELYGETIEINMVNECPILQSRKINYDVAYKEFEWIYLKNSVVVEELGCKIWDKWKNSNGTIGKSYGYQVGKNVGSYSNQLEYVIEELKKDKSSRRAIIDLWDCQDLEEMELPPCIVSIAFNVSKSDVLQMDIFQRSADIIVGLPYDMVVYSYLYEYVRKKLNLSKGKMRVHIANLHLYLKYEDVVYKLINNYHKVNSNKVVIDGKTISNYKYIEDIKVEVIK